MRSSETSVLTRATWCHITEDGILHSQRRENLKSYSVTDNRIHFPNNGIRWRTLICAEYYDGHYGEANDTEVRLSAIRA
jgi:hypothetical protein